MVVSEYSGGLNRPQVQSWCVSSKRFCVAETRRGVGFLWGEPSQPSSSYFPFTNARRSVASLDFGAEQALVLQG